MSTGPVIAGALLITLAAVPLGHAGGPPIKTQQCSVLPLKTDFTPGDRFFVANRFNVITGYTGLTNMDGYLFGAPYTTIGGASTGLSLVSRNYLAGIVRDSTGRFYVAGPNTGTVNVYPPPVAGPNSPPPIASLSTADGLSQPSGLALNSKLLYIANRGANTIATYPATDTSFVAADLKTTSTRRPGCRAPPPRTSAGTGQGSATRTASPSTRRGLICTSPTARAPAAASRSTTWTRTDHLQFLPVRRPTSTSSRRPCCCTTRRTSWAPQPG